MSSHPKYIVLYDGECGFCNRSVSFILKREKSDVLHFSALQSSFTEALFKEKNWELPDLNTFYFIEDGVKYERSTAALRVTKYLKAPSSWLRVFKIIPRAFRDWCYNFLAKRRQRISKGFCVVPSAEQRARFMKD
ncbi:MAG: putative DCC family thiol-disulfide oxidoreductase YuxK [Crocinitomicaceae bacterium]